MGRVLDDISPELATFLREQPVFFVATAPAGPDGHVNVSPKGLDGTFAVLGPHTVAYLDLTGSGVETIAHVRENGRITLMFSAFSGRPNIVRLHGTGTVHEVGTDDFDRVHAAAGFPHLPGMRSVIEVDVTRVSSSCGFGVPEMTLVGPRSTLVDTWAKRGDDSAAAYRRERNAASIDDLPALDP